MAATISRCKVQSITLQTAYELILNFPIIATDFDGDITTATIPVTIVDDKPVITDVDAISVDEDDLASVGSDGSDQFQSMVTLRRRRALTEW